MMVGRLLSYWEGNFSGATLNFGRVGFHVEKNSRNHSGYFSKTHGPHGMIVGWRQGPTGEACLPSSNEGVVSSSSFNPLGTAQLKSSDLWFFPGWQPRFVTKRFRYLK